MKKLLASIALAALLATGPATAEEPSEAAMAFAGTFSNDQLSGMLSRIGARQPTLISLSQLHGSLLATVFDLHIDKAVAEHGAAWQRNMALAWTPLLTDEEMVSLVAEGATSPYSEKYLGLRAEAGQAMQGLSQDLFRDVLAKVIQNTVDELSVPAEETADPEPKD
ncbi:MAG: hypothetical protein AAF439_15240 [Pseudomonadota bacterium]